MRRRDLITLLGGAAAWPFAAHAQQTGRVRRIGVLLNGAATDALAKAGVLAFEQVLRTLGWKGGQNLQIEYRWGDTDPNRITANAAELAALMPDLIVAAATVTFTAVLKATRIIPIVFVEVSDPVAQGFVANLAHPGNNLTGFVQYEFSIATKWLDLVRQISPALTHVGLMFNPVTSPQGKFFLEAIAAAGPGLGIEVTALPVHEASEIAPAIERIASRPNGGLIIGTDNFLLKNDRTVVELAARYRLPAVYGSSEFVQAGGLMSYSSDQVEQWRGAAYYVDRILKGANAGDLPIQLPSKFTLTINLKAVQALGLELPMGLMLSANEVIE
jgi:putative ABC transport system substrate-binding protein